MIVKCSILWRRKNVTVEKTSCVTKNAKQFCSSQFYLRILCKLFHTNEYYYFLINILFVTIKKVFIGTHILVFVENMLLVMNCLTLSIYFNFSKLW